MVVKFVNLGQMSMILAWVDDTDTMVSSKHVACKTIVEILMAHGIVCTNYLLAYNHTHNDEMQTEMKGNKYLEAVENEKTREMIGNKYVLLQNNNACHQNATRNDC
jgi:riboflavin synthase